MKLLNYLFIFVVFSSLASAVSWSGITRSVADTFYINDDGDTMTGNLNIGTGGYASGGITLTIDGGVFTQDLILAGNITSIDGIEVNGSLNPASGVTATLGNTSNLWDSIFGSKLVIVGSANVTQNLTINNSVLFVDGTGGFVGINTLKPTHQLDIVGELDIFHTATSNTERAMDIHINTSGFTDIKALEIDYIVTALTAEGADAVINILIEDRFSTGGTIEAIRVDAIGEGIAEELALSVGAKVQPIHQDSGVFQNISTGLINDTSLASGSQIINGTGNFSRTSNDTSIFENDNDFIYLGHTEEFSEIEVLLATVSSKNIEAIFQHSTSSDWDTFVPIDSTIGFTQDGTINFEADDLTNWAALNVNGTSLFWIRIQRTRNSINPNTPIEDLIEIVVGTVYSWGASGDLFIKNATITNNLVVDTSTLIVDSVNNRVGIGTATPAKALVVIGNVNISDSLNVSDTVQATKFVGDGSLLTGLASTNINNTDVNVTNFFANGTLFVDSSRVGIGTDSAVNTLTIVGDTSVFGTLNATIINATRAIFRGNITTTVTNNSFNTFTMGEFNSTCSGFRHKQTGGLILSCV